MATLRRSENHTMLKKFIQSIYDRNNNGQALLSTTLIILIITKQYLTFKSKIKISAFKASKQY